MLTRLGKFCYLPGTLLLILLAAGPVHACTCDLPPNKPLRQQVTEARQQAKAVFSGVVLSVEEPPGTFYKLVTIEIESVWKGKHRGKIVIMTGQGGGDCGYLFEVGAKYLVYAYQYNKSFLGTNICQRTSPLDGSPDPKILGRPLFRPQKTRATKLNCADVKNSHVDSARR